MMWQTWLKAASTRMVLLAFVTLSLAAMSVLTVQELDRQRKTSHFQGLAQRYAVLLDEKMAQATASMHKMATSAELSANASLLVQQQPWMTRLEQHNAAGDLVWSHVFTEPGAKQPLSLSPSFVLSMQEGASQLGQPHFSGLEYALSGEGAIDAAAQIHLAWQLQTPQRYGFASWSMPQLLNAVNREAYANLGAEARWGLHLAHSANTAPEDQWVRLGNTGVMLPVTFVSSRIPNSKDWQTYAVPWMTLLLFVALGFLYRESYLRQRAEAQTREQQERVQANARLATLGEIAAMISHEINQPLAAIETYAATCERVLAQKSGSAETLQRALSGVRAQTERAGRIIRSVQDFAQSRKEATQGVDPMEVIRELSTLIDIQAKRFMAVVKVQGVTGVLVHTDKTMLEQVLLNLIRNGLEAMRNSPENGRLLEVSVTRELPWVLISVADNGSGVSPEIRDKLFLPFVTDKAQGTGVGLSLCKSLVEKYHGQIAYSNRPAGGSIFTVRLPLEHDALTKGS